MKSWRLGKIYVLVLCFVFRSYMINCWGLLALLVDMVIERTHISTEDFPLQVW
jgi:hypothetical protein